MAETENITEITFKRTAHVLLNSGILGLERYLKKFREHTDIKYSFQMDAQALKVQSEQLPQLLEDVYYFMGNEIYDTSTPKQEKENGNVYYDKEKQVFQRFPKMNTYGLTSLLTNNAQGVTRKEENSTRKKTLETDNPALAEKFKKYFDDNNIKMLSKLYFNEPYTKISRLNPLVTDYLRPGNNYCSLTGEGFQKLSNTKNTSPFSGKDNFNSFLQTNDKESISWKAVYLSRFAPASVFYAYEGKLRESINCYILHSDTLLHLREAYNTAGMLTNCVKLKENEYISNMELYSFENSKNDYKYEFTERNEFLFMLIYTFYKRILEKNEIDIGSILKDFDIFKETDLNFPVSIIAFDSVKFASTMQAGSYEEINQFKFLLKLISKAEAEGISFQNLLRSLKFIKPSEKQSKHSYRLERQLRNKVLGNIISLKPITDQIEKLFYDCFKLSMSNEKTGFKHYKTLFRFFVFYEKTIKFGGNILMNEELQEKSINLGKSIGQSIIRADNIENNLKKAKENAKDGRGNIIALKKARTLEQFLDEIIRIQTKYQLAVSSDILNQINSKNFIFVKQFAIISALNQLNSVSTKSTDTQK